MVEVLNSFQSWAILSTQISLKHHHILFNKSTNDLAEITEGFYEAL